MTKLPGIGLKHFSFVFGIILVLLTGVMPVLRQADGKYPAWGPIPIINGTFSSVLLLAIGSILIMFSSSTNHFFRKSHDKIR